MKQLLPINPYTVAAKMKKAGIPIVSITDWKEEEDAEIIINDKYHVQIGDYYLILNWWTDANHTAITGIDLPLDGFVSRIKEIL